MIYSRRNRRQLAKQFGLLKTQDVPTKEEREEGMTRFEKRVNRTERSREAGNQIHLQFLETTYTQMEKEQEELDTRILEHKIEFLEKGGMKKKAAEKKAKEELIEFQTRREAIENRKYDERILRNSLKDVGATKREIKNALRDHRQALRS